MSGFCAPSFIENVRPTSSCGQQLSFPLHWRLVDHPCYNMCKTGYLMLCASQNVPQVKKNISFEINNSLGNNSPQWLCWRRVFWWSVLWDLTLAQARLESNPHIEPFNIAVDRKLHLTPLFTPEWSASVAAQLSAADSTRHPPCVHRASLWRRRSFEELPHRASNWLNGP